MLEANWREYERLEVRYQFYRQYIAVGGVVTMAVLIWTGLSGNFTTVSRGIMLTLWGFLVISDLGRSLGIWTICCALCPNVHTYAVLTVATGPLAVAGGVMSVIRKRLAL